VVKVELSCTEGCYFPTVVSSNEIAIHVKTKQTPLVEIYTSYLENPQEGEPIEFFAYTENVGDNVTYEWYVDNILTGNNEPFLTVNYTSGITVRVRVLCSADCLETNIAENSYTFSNATAINNPSNIKLTVYPNPTKDVVKITSNEIINKIELMDLSGNVLWNKRFDLSNPEISIENHPSGNYLLRITTKDGNIVKKIIKI
jgi:hypothetical protein